MTRYYVVTALLFTMLISGCGAVIVGGAAIGTYKAATDERSVGTMVDDSVIATRVKSELIASKQIPI